MMVYGLDSDKSNAEKLFNIFCLYGNVLRVKFLKTKEGCAMVQMGDGLAVERCVQNLNNVSLMGSKLQLGFSKQAFLSDVMNPHTLPDKTPSFKDFMGNKNNRFLNPTMASKNRIQPPSKILHFFNTPPHMTEEMLGKVFEEKEAPCPKTIKLFPLKSDRSSSGLLEFEDVGDALMALMLCNHAGIQSPDSIKDLSELFKPFGKGEDETVTPSEWLGAASPGPWKSNRGIKGSAESGKFPYTMKLCFSSSRSIPNSLRGSGNSDQPQHQEMQDETLQ